MKKNREKEWTRGADRTPWKRTLVRKLIKIPIYLAAALVLIFGTVILLSAFAARGKADLKVWHRVHLKEEFRAKDAEKGMDFEGYLALEDRLFDELQRKVYEEVEAEDAQPWNRFYTKSLSHPENQPRNWNRTYLFEPEAPKGGVLLLHGLSDSPYSMLKVAEIFRDRGYYVVALRLPGHGTAPAGLTEANWKDWMAAVRIAARAVREKIGEDRPFFVGGYSNGGALAVKYMLEARNGTDLPKPDRLYLFSPAIGVTAFARFAAWDMILSFIPYFEKSKWVDIFPEYDPFKYNSFPKEAGNQIYLITTEVKNELAALQAAEGALDLPPILAFQSAADATVVAPELTDRLLSKLKPGYGELVLFGVNRSAYMEQFIKTGQLEGWKKALLGGRLPYRLTLVTNADPESSEVVARDKPPLGEFKPDEPLNLSWPSGVYSLTHVAIPFPPEDPIYGPHRAAHPGERIHLGALEVRGERGLLAMPMAQFLRLRYNPFFPYLERRILETLDQD